nr:flagellar protein [Bradyrhizobium sp.]
MSGIVLSASVRQNLLSLQSTASLLATTQNDLATGNAVNSALDNPTSFFTAQALNSRASDISNLLDSIGNGVQVLQAANTGITSLQSLISNAQSIANQVLQTTTGYSTKSTVTSTAITGATANNLLGSGTNVTVTGTALTDSDTTDTVSASTLLVGGTTTTDGLATAPANGSSLTVDGKTITFSTAQTSTTTDGSGNVTIGIGTGSTATVQTVLSAIDGITGATTPSTVTAGKLVLSTGTTQNLVIGAGTTSALTALGLTAATTDFTPPAISGQTLTIAATNTGSTATNITFGTGAGQVSTLNELNTALAANDLQASINTTGQISITTSNNAASNTIGTIGGTAVATGAAFAGLTAAAPVADPASQTTRADLVAQYNQVLQQINTTSQDSSFNGINLLNGDTLDLTFDETGASKLSITGVTFNDAGLGLSTLTAGTDFLDNNSANKVLASLTQASTTLSTEASALGSNLSVVEIRQDFNKNLINVLQTGASNLTLADPNEEAANSQALSTRQ